MSYFLSGSWGSEHRSLCKQDISLASFHILCKCPLLLSLHPRIHPRNPEHTWYMLVVPGPYSDRRHPTSPFCLPLPLAKYPSPLTSLPRLPYANKLKWSIHDSQWINRWSNCQGQEKKSETNKACVFISHSCRETMVGTFLAAMVERVHRLKIIKK